MYFGTHANFVLSFQHKPYDKNASDRTMKGMLSLESIYICELRSALFLHILRQKKQRIMQGKLLSTQEVQS